MLIVAIWVAALLALTVVLLSILMVSMKRQLNEFSREESLGFMRLVMVGTFGIVLTQLLIPLNLRWYFSSGISLLGMLCLLLGSQLLAIYLGPGKFGTWISRTFRPLVKSVDIAFSPIASPAIDEPEEFELEFKESVEDFGQTIVREIMVPRIDIYSVPGDQKLAESLPEFIKSGRSRLPVRGKNIDDIQGILYLKDVAKVMTDDASSMELVTTLEASRKAIFVPDSKPVDDLLKQMQSLATHVAVVVDEYGGVAGLVTLEDIIEELVGEIADEYDNEKAEIEPLENGQLRVAAKSSLFELGEYLGIELEDEDIDSVGGLMSKLLGRLPSGGDQVTYSGLKLSVERFEGRQRRLTTVLVEVDPLTKRMVDDR